MEAVTSRLGLGHKPYWGARPLVGGGQKLGALRLQREDKGNKMACVFSADFAE